MTCCSLENLNQISGTDVNHLFDPCMMWKGVSCDVKSERLLFFMILHIQINYSQLFSQLTWILQDHYCCLYDRPMNTSRHGSIKSFFCVKCSLGFLVVIDSSSYAYFQTSFLRIITSIFRTTNKRQLLLEARYQASQIHQKQN